MFIKNSKHVNSSLDFLHCKIKFQASILQWGEFKNKRGEEEVLSV